MKHSKLHKALAMATVLGGASLGLLAPPVGAVQLSQQGAGDALIFPYYTVRGDWTTTLNLVNTSNVVLAVKVRFHESHNSRDVLNFTVLMSPWDRFTGSVEFNADRGAVFRPANWAPTDPADPSSIETTCIVAGNGNGAPIYNVATARLNGVGAAIPFKRDAYSGAYNDTGPQTVDRLREGYIEVIVEGHARSDTAIWSNVVHPTNPLGAPQGCAAAYNAFRAGFDTSNPPFPLILATARQFGEPINALKGSFSLINNTKGVQVQSNAVALANFVAVGVNGVYDDADIDLRAGARPNCGVDAAGNPVAVGGVPTYGMFLAPILNTLNHRRNLAWNPGATATAIFGDAPGDFDCPNLIAPQQQFAFMEPSWADAYPNTVFEMNDHAPTALNSYFLRPTFGPGSLALNSNGYGFGFLAVSEVLRASSLVNSWAANATATSGTETEWVITHPTKDFYVDNRPNGINGAVSSLQRFPTEVVAVAGNNPINTNYLSDMPVLPFAAPFNNGQACTEVGIVLFDNDEGRTSDDPDISPSAWPNLCYEANVVHFAPTVALDGEQVTNILSSKTRVSLVADVNNAVTNGKIRPNRAGWMRMDLTTSGAVPSPNTPNNYPLLGSGLPVVGFMISQRQRNASDMNTGLVDYTYEGRGVVTNVNPWNGPNHPPVFPDSVGP